MSSPANPLYVHWRWYDGTSGTTVNDTTALAGEDATYEFTAGDTVHLRVKIGNDGDMSATSAWTVQYDTDSGFGTAVTITTTSSDWQVDTGGTGTDGDAVTERLSTTARSYANGDYDEADGSLDANIASGGDGEFVWCITPVAGQAEGNTYYFRVQYGGANISTEGTPGTITCTVAAAAAPESPAAYVPRPKANRSQFSVIGQKTNLGQIAHRPSYPITPHYTYPTSPSFERHGSTRWRRRDLAPSYPWYTVTSDVNVNATAATLTFTTGTATIGFAALAASLYRPPSLRSVRRRRHLSAKQLPWWSIDVEIAATAATLTFTTGVATVGLADIAGLYRPQTLRSGLTRRHLSAKQLPWWSIDQEVAATAATLTFTTGTATVGLADLAASLHRPPTLKSGFERHRKDPREWFIFDDVTISATAAALTFTTGTATVGVADLAASLHRPKTHRSGFERNAKTLPTLPWFVPSANVEVNAIAATLTFTTGTATVGSAELSASLHRPPTLRAPRVVRHLSARQLPWWSIDQEVTATAATLTFTTGTAIVGVADLAASLHRPKTLKRSFGRANKRLQTLEWYTPPDAVISATAATLTFTTGVAKIGYSGDDEQATRPSPITHRIEFTRKLKKLPTLEWLLVGGGRSRVHREERELTPVPRIDVIRRMDDEFLLQFIGEFLDRQGGLAFVEAPSGDDSL